MSDKPQTYANHGRFDPWFHFSLIPLFLLIFLGSVAGIIFVRHGLHFHILLAALSVGVLWTATVARSYSLKVQDRVIRLEERIRLSAVLPEGLRARIPELTVRQLVALRFASDGELPALVERTLVDRLEPRAIKAAIQNWRPDTWRV